MRKLKCFQVSGLCVQDVLDEFNERAEEFGVTERDIVTVSALPPIMGTKLGTSSGLKEPHTRALSQDALAYGRAFPAKTIATHTLINVYRGPKTSP